MNAEICFVFNDIRKNERVRWLPRLRAWLNGNGPLFDRLGLEIQQRILPLDNAMNWRAETPRSRVVVTVGYNRKEIERTEARFLGQGEPVIIGDQFAPMAESVGSASFSLADPMVALRDVREQLRKSLIRIALRNRFHIRAPGNDAEFAAYFALRYRVWKSAGYLKDEFKAARTEWEVDLWDRMSIPLIAVAADGKVVGCVRLIKKFGAEEPGFADSIESLLRRNGDPALLSFFNYQPRQEQPFDFLVEFPEFRRRYSQLIRERRTLAEIGRVAVEPEHRGGYLAEALVDTALSYAQKKQASNVFLACPERLSGLYAKSGFRVVDGLKSFQFFNIQVPSVMMEKQIR